jgi:hypothetical protein
MDRKWYINWEHINGIKGVKDENFQAIVYTEKK